MKLLGNVAFALLMTALMLLAMGVPLYLPGDGYMAEAQQHP